MPSQTRFNLEEDEYIVKFEGRSGAWIDRLTFTLNSGRVFTCPEGGNGGSAFSFTAPQGYHFSSFNVGIGGHLHNISVKKFKLPHIQLQHPFEIDSHIIQEQQTISVDVGDAKITLHQPLLGGQPAQYQMKPISIPQESSTTKYKAGSTWGDTRIFDDMYLLGVNEYIKVHSITLYHCSQYLRGIKTKYLDLRTGDIITSGEHLERYRNWFPSKTTFTLEDDEHIVMFEGRSGAWMDRLTITLNSGRVLTAPFNGNGGRPFSFTAPEGYCFSGLAAGIGGHLHNVEMRLFKMPTCYMRPIMMGDRMPVKKSKCFGSKVCRFLDGLFD